MKFEKVIWLIFEYSLLQFSLEFLFNYDKKNKLPSIYIYEIKEKLVRLFWKI